MWADNETNEDLLGYQVHADLLKEVVLDSTMLPITIGIFGDWGSGKSSLMLLMKEGIDQWMKEEANKKEKVAQIQFNSWQFENYEDTKLTLIETVLTAIEKDLKKKQGVIKNGIFLPKGVTLSDFICTFAMSLMILLVLKCSTKVSEKSDMAKSWATFCCSGTYKDS